MIYNFIITIYYHFVSVLLAVAIPKLGLFISLFGAFCLSALGLAIPAIINTSTYWYSLKGMQFKIMVVKNILLILFAVLGLIVGTYISISDIVLSFTLEDNE